ncbi:DNA recombination protein RmuC [bacterium]|nr:DNA recombination protein RmuC [bacterium]
MDISLWIATLTPLVALGAFWFSLQKFQERLLSRQGDQDRNQETKASQLRTELSAQLQANRQELQQGLVQSSQALEGRFHTIDTRLDTRLKELTEGVQTKLEANLKEGFHHFARVEEALRNAQAQLSDLNRVGQSINDLNNLLKLPHLRGGFGEASLERLLSDFLPAEAFELQYRIVPGSTERVDAVIKYPKYVLPIDSKFPREQILPLFETGLPDQLEQARKNLVEVMRVLGKSIRSKYIHPEHGTTEMALLFVPSETLYFEVLRNPAICEELQKSKVFVVSPNTFAAMLHAVATARNYYEMSKGVEHTLQELRKATTHFENFQGRFEEVGTALDKAQKCFAISSTHLTRYGNAVQRITDATAGETLVPALGQEPLPLAPMS